MKLNNKGFAITTVLYGLLILFLMLFLATIKILNTQYNRMKKISDTVNDKIIAMNENYITTPNGTTNYTTYARGKYVFTINDKTDEYYVYLPSYTTMEVSNKEIVFKKNGKEIKDIKILGINNSEIPEVVTFTITSYYTSS